MASQSYGSVDVKLNRPSTYSSAHDIKDVVDEQRCEAVVFRLQILYTLYGLSVCWGSYITLWQQQELGFSAAMVGKVQAAIALVVMLCAPTFSALLDVLPDRAPECFVLVCFALNGLMHGVYVVLPDLHMGVPFCLIWITLAETLRGVCCALLDTFCVARLGKDKLQYGRVRASISMTWGLGAALIGVWCTVGSLSTIFILSPIFMLCQIVFYAAVLSSSTPMAAHSDSGRADPEDVECSETEQQPGYRQRLLQFASSCNKSRMSELLLLLVGLGCARRGFEYFLFLRMAQLPDGTTTMMGCATLIQTIAGIPAYWYYAAVNDRLGSRGVLYLCSSCYVLRALVYGQATQAWIILFIEPLHGITFALLYANLIVMASEVAPAELTGTSQGLLVRGAFEGVGGISGSIIGGIVFDYSPRVLFNSLAGLVVALMCWMAVNDMRRSAKPECGLVPVYSALEGDHINLGACDEATVMLPATAAGLFIDAVTCVDVTDNPSQVLIGSDDKTLLLYDWNTGSTVQRWQHKRGVKSTRFHANNQIISGDRKGNIQVFNREGTGAHTTINAHTMVVSALATSNEYHEIVSGSRDTTVCTWDITTGQNIASSKIERNLVTCVSWVPGAATVLQTSEDLHIRLWDTRTMQITHDVQTAHHFAMCCDVDPTGTYFVLGNNGFSSDGCEAQIWDIRKAVTPVCEYKGHMQSVNSCKFVTVGHRLLVATGSKDQTFQIWDATSAELQCSCTMAGNLAVCAVACQEVHGQTQLILGNTNGSLQVWDLNLEMEINDRLKLRHATASLGPVH